MTVIHTPKADEAAASPPSAPRTLQLDPEGEPTEVLFPEAKRRERHRRLLVLAVVVVVVGGTGLGYALANGNAAPQPRHVAQAAGVASRTGGSLALAGSPKDPYGLTVASNGDLYIVDTGRDQVLRRLSSGRFQVVAGNGHRGFSGDGGPAVDSQLSLGVGSGIVMAKGGTLYIADSGNDRVRAVMPDGDIETVAGGGREPLPTETGELVAARSAALGSPAGLTIGPKGDLYIAANFIVRLTPGGQLAWVAGSTSETPPVCNATTSAIQEANFGNAGSLAFDGAGDLVVTSGGFPGAGWGIAEIRTNGTLVDIGSCRGEGGRPGALSREASAGSVICAAQTGLFRIANRAESETLIPGGTAGGRLPSPLSAALGTGRNGPFTFFGGNGIAYGPNGTIYADTGPLASATPEAIVELYPSGTARALWKS